METKGYFIFKGNIYKSDEIMKAILENPKIKVSMNRNGDLILDRTLIKKVDKPLSEVVKNLLCFKGLSYCCSAEKPCANRDLALQLLGLTISDYKVMKEDFDRAFFDGKKLGNKDEEENSYNVLGESLDTADFTGFFSQGEKTVSADFNSSEDVGLEGANLSAFFGESSPFNNKVESEANLNGFYEVNRKFGKRTEKEFNDIESCDRCGCTLSKYAKFCPNCGTPVVKKYY